MAPHKLLILSEYRILTRKTEFSAGKSELRKSEKTIKTLRNIFIDY